MLVFAGSVSSPAFVHLVWCYIWKTVTVTMSLVVVEITPSSLRRQVQSKGRKVPCVGHIRGGSITTGHGGFNSVQGSSSD